MENLEQKYKKLKREVIFWRIIGCGFIFVKLFDILYKY
jgi:hypothetical protein